jgi:hypothetical protein
MTNSPVISIIATLTCHRRPASRDTLALFSIGLLNGAISTTNVDWGVAHLPPVLTSYRRLESHVENDHQVPSGVVEKATEIMRASETTALTLEHFPGGVLDFADCEDCKKIVKGTMSQSNGNNKVKKP